MCSIQSMVSTLLVFGGATNSGAPMQVVQNASLVRPGHPHALEPNQPTHACVSRAASASKFRRVRAKATRDKLRHASRDSLASSNLMKAEMATNTKNEESMSDHFNSGEANGAVFRVNASKI